MTEQRTSGWAGWLDRSLEERRADNLLRELRSLDPAGPVAARWRDRDLTLFSTNDYLGLSGHPRVREVVEGAVRRYGLGPRASALVCGHTREHRALEEELAELKETECALLFPTGFAANTAVLAALAGDREAAIFSDTLNHASIIDGCRMAARAGAELHVYRHGDVEHLARLLEGSDRPRKLIVTDSLFSMDGDLAPLVEIAEVKEAHGAWLVVDEAHATLVLGARGGGAAEALDVAEKVDVHVGTLSKAFGTQGGFVAGSRALRTWLLNMGRPFVFSTALPIPVVVAARAALRVRAGEPELVERLFRHLERFREGTGIPSDSPIVPVVLGTEEEALEAAERLFEEGLFVPAIRPPTVPVGTSRLRIALSAAHSEEEVERLIGAVNAL
ncbi:MAG: 8-amino-7-oxononanoate synthase [Thermoanaerobaculia bacterium]|nr:8-amino-7-oxononanoate synthase [Thermoanaerobaculia bacterium]